MRIIAMAGMLIWCVGNVARVTFTRKKRPTLGEGPQSSYMDAWGQEW